MKRFRLGSFLAFLLTVGWLLGCAASPESESEIAIGTHLGANTVEATRPFSCKVVPVSGYGLCGDTLRFQMQLDGGAAPYQVSLELRNLLAPSDDIGNPLFSFAFKSDPSKTANSVAFANPDSAQVDMTRTFVLSSGGCQLGNAELSALNDSPFFLMEGWTATDSQGQSADCSLTGLVGTRTPPRAVSPQ